MKINKFLLLLFLPVSLFAQEIDPGARIIISISTGLEDASFYIYNPPFLAKPIYGDTLEAINQFPEQLMSSILSANTQDWINYNTLGGEEYAEQKSNAYFRSISNLIEDSNYYELRAKLMFAENGNEYAIIKFYLKLETQNEDYSGAYVMKKVNNRWYKTSTPFTTKLALMIMRFKESILSELIFSDSSENEMVNDLIDIIKPNGFIDFNLLYEEFKTWYDSNDEEKIALFIDQNSW